MSRLLGQPQQESGYVYIPIHCVSKKQDTKLLPITSPNVKCRRKQASLIVGSLNATGRLFHAVGPATENFRRPYVVSL